MHTHQTTVEMGPLKIPQFGIGICMEHAGKKSEFVCQSLGLV
jgi:hypothetical protein